MRRRSNGKPDANQSDIDDVLRGVGASVCDLGGVGSGCPDRLVGYRGKTYLLETKNKDGLNRVSPRQKQWHEDWRGHPVIVVRSYQEALNAIEATEYRLIANGGP